MLSKVQTGIRDKPACRHGYRNLTRLHELRTHVCHVQRLAEGRGTPHALREAHSYQHVPRGAEEVAGAQRPSRRPLREKAVGIAGSCSIVRRRPDLGLKEILR